MSTEDALRRSIETNASLIKTTETLLRTNETLLATNAALMAEATQLRLKIDGLESDLRRGRADKITTPRTV